MRLRAAVSLLVAAAGCRQAQTAPLYEKVPVERRDVVVTATALGIVQPILTYSVKSKAWGEILEMPVQTGDEAKKGQLLARIDPRIPQENLTEAQAMLDKAKAQLANADAQLKRADALFKSGSIAETDFDAAKLAFATAQSAVTDAQANLQTAQDAMDDTHVRAPITGTILVLNAVLGTVISSPTLGGGTVILTMANLDTVRDSALVLETDVGRTQPGMSVTITVDAFPNRTFEGTVLKVEPQAQVVQNQTMFPVLVDIPNPGHLLRPGMNSSAAIHTGQHAGVLAVPNAALRTQRDVASAVGVLGLDAAAVQQQIQAGEPAAPPHAGGDTATGGGATFTTPNGRTITLPPGVTADEVRAAFAKMQSGGDLTDAERMLLARIRSQSGGGAGRGTGGANGSRRNANGGAGSYVVFVIRDGKTVAVPIKTGLTDQDYIEVRSGLKEGDTVLVLPSASLVQSQQQFRQRFQNVTGGGLPGLRQQSGQTGAGR